ncbi:unnamed protein product [Gadus morhua 'NCC']
MCSWAVPCLTVRHPWAARLPAFPLQTTATDRTASTSRRPPRTSRRAPPDDRHGPHGERLQTTATASASRRLPRTSRRAPPDDRHGPHGERLQTTATDLTASASRRPPPSPLLKQDTIHLNTGDFFSSLTQMTGRLLATIHLQLPAPDPLC